MQHFEGFPQILGVSYDDLNEVKEIKLSKMGKSLKELIINSNLAQISIPISCIVYLSLQMLKRV